MDIKEKQTVYDTESKIAEQDLLIDGKDEVYKTNNQEIPLNVSVEDITYLKEEKGVK